jgi:hypothetical protein
VLWSRSRMEPELLAGAGTGTFGRSWSRNVEVSAPTPALSPGQLKYRSK